MNKLLSFDCHATKNEPRNARKLGISWLMYIIQTRKVWFDVGYFNVVIYTVLY